MAIQAQMADGRVLEFPDGTDTAVIQSTVQRLISAAGPDKQPSFGSPMGEDFGSSIMAAAQPKRESVLQGIDIPAPAAAPLVKPQFIDALQANLNALPEAERTAKLEQFKQRPDVYGKAANVIAQRYADQDLGVSPTLQKLTDLRLEPQVQRFMEQGMEPEAAKNLAAQQAMMGRARPDLQQMNVDVAGEQAKAEAERVAQEMKDAGFMTRVGAEAKGQATQTGLGLINMYADLTGDKEMQGRIAGATRTQEEAGKAIPKGDSIAERAAQQALTSAATQAPMMLLGTLTGTSAPMLVQAGVQSLGSAYGEGRAAGLSPEAAMTRAAAYATAEITFERFGMTKALGGLKKYMNQAAKDGVEVTGNDIARYFGKAIVSEIPSEMATTLTQYGIDIVPGIGLNKNPSVEDLYKQLEETLRQTVIQSGVMAGAGAGVVKGAQAISSRLPERRQSYEQDTSIAGTAEQMAKERGFLAPEQKVKPPIVPATSAAPTTGRIEPTFEPDNLGAAPATNEPTMEPATNAPFEPNNLAKQRAEEQKSVLDLEQELEAPKEAAPVTPEAAPPVVVKAEEDYANKSFEELQTLRENASQTNDALDLAAVQKHFGSEVAAAYEQMNRRQRNKWWDENATEALDRDASTFNGINEDLLDEYIKAHNDFDTESPSTLGRSVGLLVRKINDPGFVGSPDFVRLKNALAYAKQQGWSEAEVLGGMRARAVEWAGADAQELFKDLFKAKPVKTKAAELAPAAEEETIPFFGEDLTGKPMPDRPEVQKLLTQAEEASKAAEQLNKRTAGTSLFKVLQGSLANSEMSELGGRSRQVGKNPFMSLVAKKGKPGSSMEDMVDSGALDLFLPENMRPGNPMYDNGESAAYIREKLIQGQYYTYDTEIEIRRVTEGIWDLDKLINEELSIDDINKEIELAFDEQREADLAAAEIVPEGEARSAEQRKAAATNDELDKREAQLEREAQLNKREARLLEERKRLEEERLKLEGPTEEEVVQEEERKSKAAELDEREQIRKESEAGAGQFELTREEGRQDTTGNLFEQPTAEPETVAISPEQERKEALEQFEQKLRVPVQPFYAKSANKTQLLKPAPLTNLQIKEILDLASKALDLGMPAAVLGNVTSAGSTRKKAAGVMSETGQLMIGSEWKTASTAEKLQVLIHELGHSIDFNSGKISNKADWSKAHAELKNWYAKSANKFTHPLFYPFSPQYKGAVRYEMESFAQAFHLYFTSPADLQKNAPEAYSQIQAIVERIQDGSQKAREAGTTERGTAAINVQPSRVEKNTAVQPSTGAIGAGVGGIKGVKNRGAASVTGPEEVEINASVGQNIFNQRPLVSWTAPDMTKWDDFVKYWQNRHVDTKRIVAEITRATGAIEDRWNPYLMEELFHGRAAKQTKDFLVNELRPLLKEMGRLGVTIPELEEYMHNKHAEERNIQIAKVNPTQQDQGSGIKTADARAYLNNLSSDQKAKFDQVDRMVKVITGNTRQMLVDSGLESQETVDAWEKTYGDYVPLNREDVEYSSQQGKTVGQGYSVRGSASKRAIGSTRNVVDILANIALQRESTIVRAEKNRVATSLYGLALKSPNPTFWLAVNPNSKKDLQATINELVNMGLTAQDAQSLMQEPTQKIIDPQTGLVTERINPVLRGANNVMSIRINGKDRFVFFNQNNKRANRMVTALKNLDADQLGIILGTISKVTRYFASVNTQYNPVFGVYNFLRDTGGGAIQLTNTPLAGKQIEVGKQVMPAVVGIYAQLRADHNGRVSANPMAKLWEDFQQEGGQTGFRDQFSRAEERTQALERELKKLSQGKANQVKQAIFNWLSDYNETMENAVRLAAYKVALDDGMSKAKAASLAKNLTVNFNRKGDLATQAGALFAFFNSSVQGTATMAATLAAPAGKFIIGGGLFAGTMQAVMLSMYGFGDDDPPDFVKDKSFIFPRPDGTYGAFPMPLGYNIIPSTARIITEGIIAAKEGKKIETAKRIEHLLGLYMDAFNPIGNAGWSMQTITPTAFDWLAALKENKDWTGKPIAREDFNKLDPTPGHMRAKESASIFGKTLSKFLNYVSGGTEDVAGILSPTPDQIDYLIGQATGGLGREVLKATSTIKAISTGEDLPPHKIPLIGRFYGDTKGSSSVANHFYENIKKMNEYENTIKGMATRDEDTSKFIEQNPESALYVLANRIEKNVQQLRKLRHGHVEAGAKKEVIQSDEKLIVDQMMVLNQQIEEINNPKKKK